jgi:hypothetical protein
VVTKFYAFSQKSFEFEKKFSTLENEIDVMPPLEAETSRGDFFRVKHTKQK